MKRIITVFLLASMLLASVFSVSAQEAASPSFEEIVHRAIDELTMDGPFPQAHLLTDSSVYHTFITCWPDPATESVNGETWYVRFEALDRAINDSYIVALNEDGELRYLDVLPSDASRQKLGTVSFIDVFDRYRDRFGQLDTWNEAAFMSFATELSKGQADGRNAWRFQHAVFIPVPENAISKAEAKAIAAQSINLPTDTAATCICLWDTDKAIYKISFSYGYGWGDYMVELDCLTGEVLQQIPFDDSIHGWADCFIPQSLIQQLPPPEAFLPSNG
ncbi:MAG: hypothetical protein IKK75_03680 [Clostridia bacterium]|nr:hypothetical protein [Clostridia bacterium]